MVRSSCLGIIFVGALWKYGSKPDIEFPPAQGKIEKLARPETEKQLISAGIILLKAYLDKNISDLR